MADEEVWTVKAALDWTCGYLERKGDENPRLSAEWLLCEACGMRRIDLYLNFDRPLSMEERDVLRGYVTRRGRGEPLQYITGEAPFRYITLKVRPGVLIPRPETEVLVSEAIACLPPAPSRAAAWNAESAEIEAAAVAELKEKIAALRSDGAGDEARAGDADAVDEEATGSAGEGGGDDLAGAPAEDVCLVADVCTGTGCIACAIASERPDARVIATDLAPEAVALARENASQLGLADRVKVLAGDLLAPVPARFAGKLDLVVSNPPYVPTAVLAGIPHEVAAFEPALALDGGADGLDLFRRLAVEALPLLKPGGALACELHETRLSAAAVFAREAGYVDVRIVDDLAGRQRVLVCRKPNVGVQM